MERIGPMAFVPYISLPLNKADRCEYVQGEIDILEGVNDQAPDLVSIHTSPGE